MTTAQTTRTPAFVQADWHSGRVVDRAGRTATAAEVLTALNAALADRDRLRAALEDMVYLADDLTDGQLAADCESERNFNAAHERGRAALAQSDKGE